MDATVDLYKELNIDRSWDCPTIRRHLNKLNMEWVSRQNTCNPADKETVALIDDILARIEDATRYLIHEEKRKKYDKELDRAYSDGKIEDEIEEKLVSILDQARAYFNKGNIQLATQCALEAVEGRINDPSAYNLLARCYVEQSQYDKALEVVDNGSSIFQNDLDLKWLGARIAIDGKADYDQAQKRINELIEINPEDSIGYSEQVYLHLRKGDDQLAFQEIDTHIANHPEDDMFRLRTAHNLDTFSNSCYYYDEAQDCIYIADKESYHLCVKLRAKANEIYDDSHTRSRLKDAKYYGQKEWDSWNSSSILSVSIYSMVFLLLFWPVGLLFLTVDALLIYFSFRPYWQINKTHVSGRMGTGEQIVNTIGRYTAKFGGWLIRFIWNALLAILRFIIWLVTGGPFK